MAGDDGDDDYLNMTFEEAPAKKETSLQRTARLKKQAADRARILPKAEREEAARTQTEVALATEMDSTNKGAKMMAKMGFKGGALGKTEGARTQPIDIQVKEGRGGIGVENDRKRKLREAAEALDIQEKRAKLDENDYREQKRREREEKQLEGQMWSAMRVLEGFEPDESPSGGESAKANEESKQQRGQHPPLKSINVLWRPLAKSRLQKDRERRMRYDLDQSLSRRDDYTEEDNDDRLAYGTEVEEDLDEEDTELEHFDSLSFGERLEKLLAYLREKHNYCFWCKMRYPDEEMEGCPGLSEDEHG